MWKKPVILHLRLRTNEAQIVEMVQKFETELQQLNSKVEEIRSELIGLREDFQSELEKVNISCLSA